MKIGGGSSNTQQVFWVVMGSFSSFGLAIVSSAILSRYFPKEEYGTYKQVVYVYSTLLLIFTAGLPQVFSYFLPRYSINEGKDIIWKISKVLFLGGLAFSIFLFLSAGAIADFLKNPKLEEGLKVFSPIPMLLLPTLGIEGIFSTYKKTIFIGIYDSSTRILTLLFIVLPVILFNGSYISAIYGWLVVSFISLFIAIYFKGIPFKGVKHEKSYLSYKEILSYSLPLMAAGLCGIGVRSADQFFVSRFFGAKVFADFSNGFIQLPLISIVAGATAIVLTPIFSRMVHEQNKVSDILALWRKAILKSVLIIYPVAVFFFFFANNIIVILYSKVYESSIIYFRIKMLLNFFTIITFTPIFLALGKTKLMARVQLFLTIAVWSLEYVSIKVFDSPLAIAFVSVFIGITTIFIWMQYISKFLNTSFYKMIPFRIIIKVLLHTLCIVLIVKFGIRILEISSAVIELAVAFPFYIVIVIYTSRFLKLDYLDFLRPLLDKNKSVNRIRLTVRRLFN